MSRPSTYTSTCVVSLGALGERERVLEHLRAAEALANALGDERRLARVNVYIARLLSAQGEYEQAVTACERAIAMARTLDDYGLEVVATNLLGLAYYCLGNYPKAVEALRRNLVPLDSPVVRERFGAIGLPFANSRASLALALAERGEFVEAIARCTEAIQIAEAVGHPYSVTVTYRGMGHLHLRRGDLHQATLALEHALEICQGVDSPPLFHAVSSALGYAYALSGRSAEAIPLLEEAVERPVMAASQEGQSLRTIWLSEAYLLAGREADARAAAQRALGLARQHKERGHEAYTLRLLGEIAAREDPLDIGKAENHYRQALALAEELGMRPLIAHCHVGLGKLYRRTGDCEQAKDASHQWRRDDARDGNGIVVGKGGSGVEGIGVMRCPKCQAENREGRRFCAECGASLSLACPSCGFSNEAGEKFCWRCGQPLASPQQVATKFSSPEVYTPKHLAEKILTSKSALEGERKQVTVLFADMKGSMELLADRDPEEARKLLDPVLEHMMEAVHRYEGTVNQVMGDGIMALFGAPLAHEDHAVRACYAALRMQESVKRYADGVQRTEGVPIQIRVGLNSGEVVVGAIGSDLQMDYTAVGQTTHLAARMEQMATPGSVLMTRTRCA